MVPALGFAYLSKDEVKEPLMDSPGTAIDGGGDQTRELGQGSHPRRSYEAAHGYPGAVIDSTRLPYTVPPVQRSAARSSKSGAGPTGTSPPPAVQPRVRDARHLDGSRTEDELWQDVPPLGLGALVEVHTTQRVDIPALANTVRRALRGQPHDRLVRAGSADRGTLELRPRRPPGSL